MREKMYQYYFTQKSVKLGSYPLDRNQEPPKVIDYLSPKNVKIGNAVLFAIGCLEYKEPLSKKEQADYRLMASSENSNYLAVAEMGTEQNYNQIDGIINNESPRSNRGYLILESHTVGSAEFALAKNKNAPFPFATWQRNLSNDKESGQEDWFWRHYFSEKENAVEDFKKRISVETKQLIEGNPSIRFKLKAYSFTEQNHKQGMESLHNRPGER